MNNDIAVLREVVKKLTPMLAGVGIKVTQRGTQAYCATDPKTLKPIRINIPEIPDNASEALILAIQGFIDHECSHALHTEHPAQLKAIEIDHERMRARGLTPKALSGPLTRMWNIVEDPFIERKMMQKFPGARANLDRLHEFFLEHITKPMLTKVSGPAGGEDYAAAITAAVGAADESRHRARFGVLVVPLVRAWSGQAVFQRFIEPFLEEFSEVIERIDPAVIASLPKIKTSWGSLDAAIALDAAITKAFKKPEPPKEEKPPEPPPPPKEEKPPEPPPPPAAEEPPAEPTPEPEEGDAEEPEAEEPEEGDKGEAKDDEPGEGAGEEDEDDVPEDAGDEDEGDDAGADDPDPAPRGEANDAELGEDEVDPVEGDGDEDDEDGEREDADAEGEPGDEGLDGEPGGDPADLDGDEPDAEESDEPGVLGTEKGDGDSDYSEDERVDADHTEKEEEVRSWTDEVGEDSVTEFDEGVAEAIGKDAVEAARDADYVVYTRDLDKIEPFKVKPAMWRDEWLTELEDETRAMVGVMQKEIERMMAARSRVVNVPGYRSGRLHSAALHRLTSGDSRVFRRKQENKSQEVAVGLLVDNSGSMGGGPVEIAMKAAFALSQTLERARVQHEVLGFTTLRRDYAGADAASIHEEEVKMGRRFSRYEPLYMPVFKAFHERLAPETKKRFAFAPHLDFLRNNVDGECVEIAARRLLLRKEPRRVLLVLSDGAPCAEGNPREQDRHLKNTVKQAERMGVETIGIGICDDAVRRYYPKHIVLHSLEALPAQVMKELRQILLGSATSGRAA